VRARPFGLTRGCGPPRRGERGTGLLATSVAVLVFLVFLLFAVQVVLRLSATSTADAALHDAARRVAAVEVDHDDPRAVAAATRSAEAQLRDLLGPMGRTAEIGWEVDRERVRLHLVADAPGVLPAGLADTAGLRRIDRTVVVQVEHGPGERAR